MEKCFNTTSLIRDKVIEFMEDNPVLNKLIGLDWYKVENGLVQFICDECGIDESSERLFSKCNELEANDYPTAFEEKIYRKVEEHYQNQDVLAVIDEYNDYRKENNMEKYDFNSEQLQELIHQYKDNLEYDGHMDLAREALETIKEDYHIV